jgi:sn-glycerol 3-phosphate transport system ATP-binding protein
MNLLRLDRAAGEAVIAGTEGPGVAPLEWAGGMLGVRPEHVLLARDGPFTARVESVEYLGADSLLLCRIGEQILTARVAGRVGVAGGDSARLGWARGASHFFDAATGIRLAAEPIHQNATMLA